MLGALKKTLSPSPLLPPLTVFFFSMWPAAKSEVFLPQSGAEVKPTRNK